MKTLLLIPLALLVQTAAAQEAKVAKAQKFFDKYSGDQATLDKARDAVLPARDHITTRDQANTWVLYADIVREYSLNRDFKSMWQDPALEALHAYDVAVGKVDRDAFTERILEGVLTLESQANSRLVDAYERKDFEAAWKDIRPLIDAHGIVRQIGRLDPTREQAALQYATLTAMKLGKLGDAVQYHKDLDRIGGRKVGTTSALAEALAAQDAVKALEFVSEWSDASSADATLLETRFQLLMQLGKQDEIRTLLQKFAKDRGSAIAITLLHARTLDVMGDAAAASATYDLAKNLEPSNQDVLRGHADLLVRVAAAEADPKLARPKRERAIALLEESRTLDGTDLPTLEKLYDLYVLVELKDKAKLAALEAKIAELK